MGQIEVYEFLKRQRASGNDKFWVCPEVQKSLLDEGLSSGMLKGVPGDLLRLELSGYLEIEMKGGIRLWQRSYRLKKKYLR